MKFTKMHGIGNDYVYVNCFEETVADPERTARFVSDRHFGVGSDGLILIKPTPVADCEMEMYNLDGSLGAMCGNGIRCVAKYAYDHGIVNKERITVATGSGVKTLDLTVEEGKVSLVKVNMGAPVLEPELVPVRTGLLPGGSELQGRAALINVPIRAARKDWRFTAVSMGNPHAVIFVPEVDNLDLEKTGPEFEEAPCFPDRVNTEFVKIIDDHTLQMRVWERGSGETLACGTGACAVAVAAILNGHVSADTPVTVKLLGGDLTILWDRGENQVYMTGPATEVFRGEIDLPF